MPVGRLDRRPCLTPIWGRFFNPRLATVMFWRSFLPALVVALSGGFGCALSVAVPARAPVHQQPISASKDVICTFSKSDPVTGEIRVGHA